MITEVIQEIAELRTDFKSFGKDLLQALDRVAQVIRDVTDMQREYYAWQMEGQRSVDGLSKVSLPYSLQNGVPKEDDKEMPVDKGK